MSQRKSAIKAALAASQASEFIARRAEQRPPTAEPGHTRHMEIIQMMEAQVIAINGVTHALLAAVEVDFPADHPLRAIPDDAA